MVVIKSRPQTEMVVKTIVVRNQRVGISKFPGAAIKEDCQRQEFNRPVKFLNSPWSRYGVMNMDSTLTNNKIESTINLGF